MDESAISPAFNKAACKQPGNTQTPIPNEKQDLEAHNKNCDPYITFGPNEPGRPPSLKLDVEKYIDQFDGFPLTEDEKKEILEDLWNIMCRFVELGFNLDSYSQACEQNRTNPRETFDDLVDSKQSENDE